MIDVLLNEAVSRVHATEWSEFFSSLLVLLCHKRSRAEVSRLRRQHGHRGSRLARATVILRRRVLIENGACRSGRSGATTRREGLAPGRDVGFEHAPDRG
jgi:hypothetical protein